MAAKIAFVTESAAKSVNIIQKSEEDKKIQQSYEQTTAHKRISMNTFRSSSSVDVGLVVMI